MDVSQNESLRTQKVTNVSQGSVATLCSNTKEKTLRILDKKSDHLMNELNNMFFALLSTPKSAESLREMLKNGELEKVLPEIMSSVDNPQNNIHHIYDIFNHTLKAVEIIDGEIDLQERRKLLLTFAALLHDIGKPETKKSRPSKQNPNIMQDTFYGHAGVSAQIADRVLSRFSLSPEEKDHIITLVTYHDELINYKSAAMMDSTNPHFKVINKENIGKLIEKIGGVQVFDDLMLLIKADIHAQNLSLLPEKEATRQEAIAIRNQLFVK